MTKWWKFQQTQFLTTWIPPHAPPGICSLSPRKPHEIKSPDGDVCIYWAPSSGLPLWGFPDGLDSKECACNAGDPGSIPESGRFPWRWEWQPTPVFLPGESHGQRRLAGYSSRGDKESDTTERLALWGKGAVPSNKASGGEGREASSSSPGQRQDTQVASGSGSWQPAPCVSSLGSKPSAWLSPVSWECLWGCVGKRLAFELVNWEKANLSPGGCITQSTEGLNRTKRQRRV